MRALSQYYGLEIPRPVMANLALETETRELGVPAGLQDRVVQVYEGLVYMDFDKALMDRQGYGNYEPLDPAQLPQVYLAYRTSLSEGTEVFHANVRERWLRGDPEVVEAMRTWASYAERGRAAMQAGDYETLDQLIDANFDLRAQLYHIDEGNLRLVQTARRVGATANFAGSGGAIVGSYKDRQMYDELVAAMGPLGAAVIQPVICEQGLGGGL
jgi:glucuronokinase